MRRLIANSMLAGLGLALPLWAFGQTAMPVIPALPSAHPKPAANAQVWQRDGNAVSVTVAGKTGAAAPVGAGAAVEGQTRSAEAGIRLSTRPGITAHANVREIRWAPLAPDCASPMPGAACLGNTPAGDGVQHGEIGAGFNGGAVKLDVSVGQTQSVTTTSPALTQRLELPTVLPAQGGADVAAPLWFRNSTATSIDARSQVHVAPDTSLNLGASVGHVHFLPGSDPAGAETLDQTTLSLGIQHGAVRGTIVGHVLEPTLPDAAFDQSQRWSGIDLGISVRLPWRGELNFGAQNVWTSGHTSLFGPASAAPDQGRVPYVQYHQDL